MIPTSDQGFKQWKVEFDVFWVDMRWAWHTVYRRCYEDIVHAVAAAKP